MEAKKVCSKCSGELVQGFIPDSTYGANLIGRWHAGAPKKSFWSGTNVPGGGLPIGAFRCDQCGFLEFYADKEYAAT